MRWTVAFAAALVVAFGAPGCGGAGRDSRANTGPDGVRQGRESVDVSPTGVALGPKDAHRQRGADMAPPYIRGPIADGDRPAVLYIHGGGWLLTGAAYTRAPVVERWARAGVAVWSTDYRRDADSLGDVEYAYRQLRGRVGPERRVCVHGESAGGQLALMLAKRYRSIRCVITDSGAVDLLHMPEGSLLEIEVEQWLLPFGGARRWDPLTNAKRISQPVLLIAHRRDPVIPVQQSRRMSRALSRAELIELPPGPQSGPPSYHGPPTTQAAADAAWSAMKRLVLTGRL